MVDSKEGAGCVIVIFVILGLLLAAAVLLPDVLSQLKDSQAERSYARAEELRQQAALTDAQTAQKAEQSEQFRRELQVYAVTLLAFTQTSMVEICIGAGGMLVALLALAWWQERYR
jgi:Na+-transporting NADH:ubiquinone oxidoreductase subunit NqrC